MKMREKNLIGRIWFRLGHAKECFASRIPDDYTGGNIPRPRPDSSSLEGQPVSLFALGQIFLGALEGARRIYFRREIPECGLIVRSGHESPSWRELFSSHNGSTLIV